jgi:hypothetical protein
MVHGQLPRRLYGTTQSCLTRQSFNGSWAQPRKCSPRQKAAVRSQAATRLCYKCKAGASKRDDDDRIGVAPQCQSCSAADGSLTTPLNGYSLGAHRSYRIHKTKAFSRAWTPSDLER